MAGWNSGSGLVSNVGFFFLKFQFSNFRNFKNPKLKLVRVQSSGTLTFLFLIAANRPHNRKVVGDQSLAKRSISLFIGKHSSYKE